MTTGPLALVGGREFTEGCGFDAELAAAVGAGEVVVVPAAAAYLDRRRVLDRARAWFDGLGLDVAVVDVWDRRGATDDAAASTVGDALMIYLLDGAAMHLRSVLHESPVLDALVDAWRSGSALAASGAGADVLCDAMVDARGGAFTVGLGVLTAVSVIPHHDAWSRDKVRRTVRLASPEMTIAGIGDATALIWEDRTWRQSGVGSVQVYRDGETVRLEDLPSPV